MALKTAWRAPLATLAVAAVVSASAAPVRARFHARGAQDSSFAGLVAQLSEAPGYFDSDNIITNEASYLHVASQLAKVGTHGGAYIGVGPDQNFSYIGLIRPTVAFMFDIRRDNLLEHLLFKSYFMMARNRLEYLCLLLGKPAPTDVDAWTGRPMSAVLAYIGETKSDSAFIAATRKASNDKIAAFGVPLDARDHEMIERYRTQFVTEGLDTRYSSLGRNNRFDYPSYGRLIMETDRAGKLASYAADEGEYQYVRSLQLADKIIPVVGNVAGPKAFRAVAAYIGAHGLKTSALYMSNVEQYLMTRDGGFDGFAKNVALLPHDSTGVIIRSYFGRFGMPHPLYVSAPGNISTSMVERIDSFDRAFSAGELTSYSELVFKRYITP